MSSANYTLAEVCPCGGGFYIDQDINDSWLDLYTNFLHRHSACTDSPPPARVLAAV